MSSGVAKRQRRKLTRQPEVPKQFDVVALKTARRAQHQLAGARAQVMADRAIGKGLAGALADCEAALEQARRRITDLKWALALTGFVLGSAVVLLIVGVLT